MFVAVQCIHSLVSQQFSHRKCTRSVLYLPWVISTAAEAWTGLFRTDFVSCIRAIKAHREESNGTVAREDARNHRPNKIEPLVGMRATSAVACHTRLPPRRKIPRADNSSRQHFANRLFDCKVVVDVCLDLCLIWCSHILPNAAPPCVGLRCNTPPET